MRRIQWSAAPPTQQSLQRQPYVRLLQNPSEGQLFGSPTLFDFLDGRLNLGAREVRNLDSSGISLSSQLRCLKFRTMVFKFLDATVSE